MARERGFAHVAAIVCLTLLTLAVMGIIVQNESLDRDPVAELKLKARMAYMECYYTGSNSQGWGCPESTPVDTVYSAIRGLTGARSNRPKPVFRESREDR